MKNTCLRFNLIFVHFANINIRNLTGERIVSADDGPHWFDDTPSLSDGR